MNYRILTILFSVILLSCNNDLSKLNTSENSLFASKASVDSARLAIIHDNIISKTQFLKDFLKEPIKLAEFKKNHGPSNNGGLSGNKHFYKPDKEGFYYRYFYFWKFRHGERMYYHDGRKMGESDLFKAFQIYVYHFGDNASFAWSDNNEILIGFKSAGIHNALGQANLVGKTLHEIEELFGNDYIDLDDIKIYSHNKRVLSLRFNSSKLEWFKYYHHSSELNPDKIPDHLLVF